MCVCVCVNEERRNLPVHATEREQKNQAMKPPLGCLGVAKPPFWEDFHFRLHSLLSAGSAQCPWRPAAAGTQEQALRAALASCPAASRLPAASQWELRLRQEALLARLTPRSCVRCTLSSGTLSGPFPRLSSGTGKPPCVCVSVQLCAECRPRARWCWAHGQRAEDPGAPSHKGNRP